MSKFYQLEQIVFRHASNHWSRREKRIYRAIWYRVGINKRAVRRAIRG